ncbi:MAG: hypothetical protein H7Z72_06505 [Bacteroidetes bacterium]|nr:hypothetical protein [Fibrella sp.]
MKKILSTLVLIALLTTGAMAQRGYGPAYGPNRYPAGAANPRADDRWDAYRIDQLDRLVGLSRRQEKEMKRVENSYDKLATTPTARRNPAAFQQQKQQAILAVLTPAQRNALFAYQQQNRRGGVYGRRG